MAQKIINTKIREAYDTEANWIKYNPVLLAGQMAFSSDKYGKYKIGDGVAKWSQLQYMTLGWNDITGKPSSFTPSSHTHDDRYFTETEATNKFSPKEGSASLSKLASTITLGAGDAATILQNGNTYQQKIEISDNATSGDAVFGFYQSGDSGKNFNKLMTINDDGNIVANKFTGALSGNASSASSVPWSGITGKPSSFAPSTHTHPASQITGLPTKLPNPQLLTFTGAANTKYDGSGAITVHIPTTSATPNSLTMQLNGGTTEGTNKFTFNGSAAKTVNITPSVIGAATVSHTHSQYALASHTHTISQITDIGSASVKYATTAGSANAVAWANISGKPTTFNPATHSHTPSQVGLGNVNNTADANKNVNSAKYIQDSNDGANIAISYRDQDVKTASWFPVFVTSKKIGTISGSNLRNTIGAAAKDHLHDSGISHVIEKKTSGVRYVKIAELVCNCTYHRLNQQLIFASRERAVLLNVKAISGNNTIFTASIDYVPISENSHDIINNLYAGLVNISSTQNRIEIWYKQVQWAESLCIIPLGRNAEGYVLTFKNYSSTDAGSTSAPTFTKTIPINSVIRWENVVGRPSTFTPSSHSHTIANITNLQSALNGKASTSHSHSNYATTTNLGLANQRIDAHEKELGVHKTLIDGKAATSHTHNTINDFSNGKATGISPNTFVTPTTAVDYDIVVTNTNPFGNKFVAMRKIDFINHVISKVPLKAITNAQIDSLASL